MAFFFLPRSICATFKSFRPCAESWDFLVAHLWALIYGVALEIQWKPGNRGSSLDPYDPQPWASLPPTSQQQPPVWQPAPADSAASEPALATGAGAASAGSSGEGGGQTGAAGAGLGVHNVRMTRPCMTQPCLGLMLGQFGPPL